MFNLLTTPGRSDSSPSDIPEAFAGVWWCLLVFYGVLWCTVQFSSQHSGSVVRKCLVVFSGVWWYLVVFDGVFVVFGGVQWCSGVFRRVWWHLVVLRSGILITVIMQNSEGYPRKSRRFKALRAQKRSQFTHLELRAASRSMSSSWYRNTEV